MSSRLVEVGKDLTSGTMAGIAQLLVGHPFDTVKVKLQSQMASSQPPKYSGAWDAVKKIVANEGPKGLYRGLGAPLAAVALFNAVLFIARGQMEALLSHNKKEVYTTLSVRQQMVTGMGAGVAVSFVACPTELIKCKLQAQSSITVANSAPPPPARTLLESESDSPILDEENKPPEIRDQDTQQSTSIEAPINPSPNFEILNLQEDRGLRTLVVNYCVPGQQEQNVVDSEALGRPEAAEIQPSKYSGSVDVAVQIFRSEGGVLGFFKGLSPTFLREVFGNAAYFGSYQGTKQLMSKGGTGEDLSNGSLLVAGGIAGAMFWLLVYPVDVIKSMIQIDDYHNPKYIGVFDAFQKVFNSQGMKGFYYGFGPAMARSILANAICFYVYELIWKAFK